MQKPSLEDGSMEQAYNSKILKRFHLYQLVNMVLTCIFMILGIILWRVELLLLSLIALQSVELIRVRKAIILLFLKNDWISLGDLNE